MATMTNENNPLWRPFVHWHQQNYWGRSPNLAIKEDAVLWSCFLHGAAAERNRKDDERQDMGLVINPEGK